VIEDVNQSMMAPTEVYLNAADAQRDDLTYYDKCRFTLSKPVIALDGWQMYVSLSTFIAPHSFGVISPYNNTFTVNDVVCTIRPCHYGLTQLMTLLNDQLPTGTVLSFDKTTFRLTLTSDVVSVIGGTMLNVLGFTAGQTGNSIEADRIVDCTGSNSIFVVSNMMSSNQNVDSDAVSGMNVFSHITISTQPYQSIVQYQEQNQRVGILIDDTALSTIEITLLDESMNPLCCQLPYRMTLQIRYIKTGKSRLQVLRPTGFVAYSG
jgi:hypothetical protein